MTSVVHSNGTLRAARTKELDQGESHMCMQWLPNFVEVIHAHRKQLEI